MGISLSHAAIIMLGIAPLVLIGLFIRPAQPSSPSEATVCTATTFARWRAIIVPLLGMGVGVAIAIAAIHFGGAWAGAALMATILTALLFGPW